MAPPTTLGEVARRGLRPVVAAREVTTARAAGEGTRSVASPERGTSGLGSLITDRGVGRRQCAPVGDGVGDDSARQREGDTDDQE